MTVPIVRPSQLNKTGASTGGSPPARPRPAPAPQTAGKPPSRATAQPAVEQHAEVRKNGVVVGTLAVIDRGQVPGLLEFYPEGPGRVAVRQGLTISGPPKSFSSATVAVEITLPCLATEESVMRSAQTTKVLTEAVLELLANEAGEYLLKTYG